MPNNLQTILAKIDIQNFSGEISGIVKEELKKMALANNDVAKNFNQFFQDQESQNQYLLQYQQALKTTFSTLLPNETILQLSKAEVGSYVTDGLRKFTVSTGGKYVDELLTPALGFGIKSYAEDALFEYLDSKESDLNDLVNTSLSYLTKQGIQVKQIGETELIEKLTQIKNQLPSYYLTEPLFNKIINQAVYLIKSKPDEIVFSLQGDLRKKFTQEFLNVRQSAETFAKNSFKELGEHIKTLTDNENIANEVLETFKNDINSREKQIKTIEDDINFLIKNGGADLATIGSKQVEHASLIAENLFHVNFLNKYLKTGIQIIDSFDSYKADAEKIFSGQYLKDFQNNLDKLKNPSFSSVISFATDTVNSLDVVANTLEKFGPFKNAAKSVGKFVGYAKIAIGIATALLPPNPIGIIGAIGSLGGLFGGGGPSLEEQMFDEMQKSFNQLNERLGVIESKIDKLADMIQESYKNIMQSLQLISNQLSIIAEQLDLNSQMLNYVIYKDYNLVDSIIDGKEQFSDFTGLELYRRWYAARQLTMTALVELAKLIESSRNLNEVIRQDFLIPGINKKFEELAKNELASYLSSLALFKNIFPNVSEKTKNLLLLPPQKNQFKTYQQGYNLMVDSTAYNFEAATENYYNSAFICKLVDQYIILQPFFVLSKNNQFEPFNTVDELIQAQQTVKDKLGPSKGRLTNLLNVVNFSIVQQSILAGTVIIPFINTALYGNNVSYYQAAISALKTNELLAKNLAVYLIRTKIDKSDMDVFSKLFYEVSGEPGKIDDLNKLLKYGQGRLTFGFDNLNPANPVLSLFYQKDANSEKIQFLVPDLTVIQEEQMLQSSALAALLAAKQKIITALIDIGFFQKLSTQQQNIYKDIFFLQS